MNWPPPSKTWAEFPLECLWYLMPGVFNHITFLVGTLILFWLLCLLRLKPLELKTILFFQGFLLLFAMLANGFWSCAIFGRFYWSVDYTSDFSVFHPISRGLIDYSWGENMSGGLRGVDLWELNLIWAGFNLTVWSAALASTIFAVRRVSKDNSLLAK